MSMVIDGIAASQHVDSSGEVLDIKGHDISDLIEGKGVLNFEHASVEEGPENILGHITFAKKIFGPQDCDNERELMYWDMCEQPFVYIKAELFDDEMHPGAVAAAALIRYYVRRGEKILAGFSIEGSTLERDGNYLKRSVGRRVALTLRPCNKTAVSGLLEDTAMADAYRKSESAPEGTQLFEVSSIILEEDPFEELAILSEQLIKTLTAGGAGAAPSQLVQGAALSRESIIPRTELNSMKAKFRDWTRTRPLIEYLKAELPGVSESYINHFAEVAHQVSLRKGIVLNHRVAPGYSDNQVQSPEQQKLISGIHLGGLVPYDPGHSSFRNQIHQAVNDSGQEVLVKPSRKVHGGNGDFDTARHASAYHAGAVALGMGKHAPVTNHFNLNHDGRPVMYKAIEKVKGGIPLSAHPQKEEILAQHRWTGDLQKLFLTDLLLGGGWDRKHNNVMVAPEGHLVHIDNDESLMHHDRTPSGYIVDPIHGKTQFHDDRVLPRTSEWIRQLNPQKLLYALHGHGVGLHEQKAAVNAVMNLKMALQRNPRMTMGELHRELSGREEPKTMTNVIPMRRSELELAGDRLISYVGKDGTDSSWLKLDRREGKIDANAGRLLSAIHSPFLDICDVVAAVRELASKLS